MVSNRMTIDEIRERFPSEWILVTDPVTNKDNQVLEGTVAFHSKDRDEIYRQAISARPRRFATLFTGRLASNAAVIL